MDCCLNYGKKQLLVDECQNLNNIVARKDIQYLSYLIEEGINLKCQCTISHIERISLVHTAVISKNIEMLTILLENGLDVNAKTNNELTPLHFACNSSIHSIDLVKLLIKKGADVNSKTIINNMFGYGKNITPLIKASMNLNYEVIEFLLDNGAEKTIYDEKDIWINSKYSNKNRKNVDEFIEGLEIRNIKPVKSSLIYNK
jgi:hypothetical protein